MSPKTKEIDRQMVTVSVRTLIWCFATMASAMVAGSWSTAIAFNNLSHKIDVAWTEQDAQRASNWLRQDNISLGLKVRETDDVIRARYVSDRR